MKTKIVILTPVYNDWNNLGKLLKKINKVFEVSINNTFDLVIVNDCSKENYNHKKYKLKMINKIILINLEKNVGSQRAIAIGLKYLKKNYKKNFKTIIIDSDGQDNPKIISKILSLNEKNPKCSIAINRGQRREPIWFKLFYEAYCILVKLFCFKKIRFGNYSLVDISDLKKITEKKELWSAFPPTLSKNSNRLLHLSADREKRYGGDSKMNFYGLVYHALRVFSALKLNVLFSSFFYIFLSLIIFYENNKIFLIIISLVLIVFNLSIFLVSLNNKKDFQKNFRKIKVLVI